VRRRKLDNGANTGGMGTITITQAYTGDPAFVDPAGSDYHSPARAGYDIGADEYYPRSV